MMNSRKLHLVHTLMLLLPPTRCFAFKRALLRWCGAQIGRDVRIASSVRFHVSGDVFIGEGTWIGHDVLIAGGQAIVSIGAKCDIAPRVTITTGTHEINPTSGRVAGQGYSDAVQIGAGSWICAGATVLGGASIGSCCVVAAGAVAKGQFPARKLIGGVPAVVLRDLVGPAIQNGVQI